MVLEAATSKKDKEKAEKEKEKEKEKDKKEKEKQKEKEKEKKKVDEKAAKKKKEEVCGKSVCMHARTCSLYIFPKDDKKGKAPITNAPITNARKPPVPTASGNERAIYCLCMHLCVILCMCIHVFARLSARCMRNYASILAYVCIHAIFVMSPKHSA